MDLIERAVPYLKGMSLITVTGGEPTSNPRLLDVLRLIRRECPGSILHIETNGWFKEATPEQVLEFSNGIFITHYHAGVWNGCPDNSHICRELQAKTKKVLVVELTHGRFADNHGSHLCGREVTCHWSEGKVYGCCVGPGIPGAQGIEFQNGWQENLSAIPLPCDKCPFGQP